MSIQTYFFTFQTADGNPLANGKLVALLYLDGTSGVSQIAATKSVSSGLDENGNVAIDLWPNDQLTPETFYVLQAYSSLGLLVWQGQFTATTPSGDFVLQENGSVILLENNQGAILLET
jgi:hypothetical protein